MHVAIINCSPGETHWVMTEQVEVMVQCVKAQVEYSSSDTIASLSVLALLIVAVVLLVKACRALRKPPMCWVTIPTATAFPSNRPTPAPPRVAPTFIGED